ncbi:MAG: hypothetical protein PUG18_07430 [Lachnospiraceae bacterium]|nr:hypothetical protein [Lachnospiraceae bacterium]
MQKTMLNKSKIEYISEDKKITTTWEKRTGLQLPFENFPVGGYMSNISHREGISNSEQKVLIIRYSLNIDDDLDAVFDDDLDAPFGSLRIINVLNQVKVRTLYDVTKIRSTEDSRIHAEFSTPTPSDAPKNSITLHRAGCL